MHYMRNLRKKQAFFNKIITGIYEKTGIFFKKIAKNSFFKKKLTKTGELLQKLLQTSNMKNINK